MKVKQLKEYIKDLPDDMEVEIEDIEYIGCGECEFKGFREPRIITYENTLRFE